MRIILVVCLLFQFWDMHGQKMLLLERANKAKTTKLYVGDQLRYRLAGKENYWYERTITDMIPESKTLLLDNFPVKVDSIAMLKVNRKGIARLGGGALFAFGATLALATTVGRYIYQDKDVDAPKLYAASVVSLGTGWFLSTPRKLKMGRKFRLRVVEVRFPDPIIPPPPSRQ